MLGISSSPRPTHAQPDKGKGAGPYKAQVSERRCPRSGADRARSGPPLHWHGRQRCAACDQAKQQEAEGFVQLDHFDGGALADLPALMTRLTRTGR